jgi:Dehydrogenases with different specificities (related to short-chain alcohol dehydrogenases)
MASDTIALVTGANKGIGKEIVRRLAAEGMTVYLGARDEGRGLAAVAEIDGDVRFVRLDVTDESTVQDAFRRVEEEFGRLDLLVNNAGVVSGWGVPVPELGADLARRTLEVNLLGTITVTRTFVPLLRRSRNPQVINMSTPLGSLTALSDPASQATQVGLLDYSVSKAALNCATLMYANALRKDGIRVNAVNPGYVATDLNDHRGVLTVEQGAEAPVRLALMNGADAPTGAFLTLDEQGELGRLPW